MARYRPVERRFEAFMRTQLSIRNAMAVIVTATVASVVLGGVAITLFDHEEFPTLGVGMWWALQTVTTVGYGDVTPADTVGRLIGAVIMLEAIAFVAIVTAAITSSFVERARQQQAASVDQVTAHDRAIELAAQLAAITTRLDELQQSVDAVRDRQERPGGAMPESRPAPRGQ